MATSIDYHQKSLPWKEQPCHFTWNLSSDIFVDYDDIVRKQGYDFDVTRNLLFVENLLFMAYLEVSDRRHHWDVSKARTYLDEADDYIQNHTEPDLQTGYKSVALLNRIWIEHKSHNAIKVNNYLLELNGLKFDEKDRHVVGAVKAAVLTRLGPTVVDTALQLFEAAVEQFPSNPGFLFGALLMSGRKMRFIRKIGDHYNDMDPGGKELMDKERKYCERLVELKDDYQLGRSYLGQNLSRRGKDFQAIACDHLEMAYKNAPDVIAVFQNLVRYYRFYKVDTAIRYLKEAMYEKRSKYLNVAESHHQLALCYISKSEVYRISKEQQMQRRRAALKELDCCLLMIKAHIIASLRKAKVLIKLGDKDKAKKLYEDLLQRSENLIDENQFQLYVDYARFSNNTDPSPRIDMWHKVMDISTSFEFQDMESGKWEVKKKGKDRKKEAYKILYNHYKDKTDIHLGILYFQNFEFAKAEKTLSQLDSNTDLKIPLYLARTFLKWGREKEVQARLNQCQLEEASDSFRKAHINVLLATELGLNQEQGRPLLAEIALAIAHNQLQVLQTIQETHSSSAHIPLESECIKSYREAVRCGSLVASLELLRLIQKDYIKVTSRSKFLQIIAEIEVCCSQRLNDCLHKESNPRSFDNGPYDRDTDIDPLALNCKMMKRDNKSILQKSYFFRQAWTQHFTMEKRIIEERFQNNEGELELDGREEGRDRSVAIETVYAATDCCEKLRPLLDHIILTFEKEELKIHEDKMNQYFPIVLGEQDPERTEEKLKKSLQALFEIDLNKHYPKLYKYLLEVQPGYNHENDFLEVFYTVVNHIKHRGIKPTEILNIVQDPVKLARQCTDKVKEICDFFFHVIEEATDLRKEADKLISDIRGGMYEKADQLFTILMDNEDFVVRMGSTYKFLKMLALVAWSREKSGSHGDPAAESKMAEGKCALSKELRKSHLAVEVSVLKTGDTSSKDVLEKCRDTCKEADQLLKTAIENKKEDSLDGKAVEFPFRDMYPGDDTLQKLGSSHWKGKVKKQIKKDLKEMGIPLNDKFLQSMLQAQPCSNENENYHFIAMRVFLEECASADSIPVTVTIETDNQVRQEYQVIDLTRWCTDHAEKTAAEIAEIISR